MSNTRLLLSTQEPHRILAVECSLDSFLGYVPHALVGMNVIALQGPYTDAVLLRDLMMAEEETACQVLLYEFSGQPRMMEISCERLFSTSENKQRCLMNLQYSPAVTMFGTVDATDCTCMLPYLVYEAYECENNEKAAYFENEIPCCVKKDKALDSEGEEMQINRHHCDRNVIHSTLCVSGLPSLPNFHSTTIFDLRSCGVVCGPAYLQGCPARRHWRTARTPLIMDEAYVRRLRRRLVSAARRDGARRKAGSSAPRPAAGSTAA